MSVTSFARAFEEFAEAMGEVCSIGETFAHFTCDEVDTIARLLAVGGYEMLAAEVLSNHAQGDEEGDAHDQLRSDTGEAARYVRGWMWLAD